MRQETEREEEIYVRKLLGDRYEAYLHKIPKSEQEGVKTPDYELLITDVRVAVLEVKRLIRTPRTPENGWQVKVRANGIREATRTDNAPQRVSKLIHEAWKQLHTAPDPKILVFVNDETQMTPWTYKKRSTAFCIMGTIPLATTRTRPLRRWPTALSVRRNGKSISTSGSIAAEYSIQNFGFRPRRVLS